MSAADPSHPFTSAFTSASRRTIVAGQRYALKPGRELVVVAATDAAVTYRVNGSGKKLHASRRIFESAVRGVDPT